MAGEPPRTGRVRCSPAAWARSPGGTRPRAASGSSPASRHGPARGSNGLPPRRVRSGLTEAQALPCG